MKTINPAMDRFLGSSDFGADGRELARPYDSDAARVRFGFTGDGEVEREEEVE
jgi:hypothetical protein